MARKETIMIALLFIVIAMLASIIITNYQKKAEKDQMLENNQQENIDNIPINDQEKQQTENSQIIPEEKITTTTRIIPTTTQQNQEINTPSSTQVILNNKAFTPQEITIKKSETLSISVQDNKKHNIACYYKSQRVSESQNIVQGQTFSTDFDNSGEHLCVDAIYGARLKVIVE